MKEVLDFIVGLLRNLLRNVAGDVKALAGRDGGSSNRRLLSHELDDTCFCGAPMGERRLGPGQYVWGCSVGGDHTQMDIDWDDPATYDHGWTDPRDTENGQAKQTPAAGNGNGEPGYIEASGVVGILWPWQRP